MTVVAMAAGGTAGHVMPALAVAAELRDRGARVEFFGGERAEAELVPPAGYPLHRLRVAALDRRNPLRAAGALALAAGAAVRARRLLKAIGAQVVVGGGGYVSAPVGLAARSLGLPLVLFESDSRLGVANRALAPLADRVFLSFPPRARAGPKYSVSGRPVAAPIGHVDRGEARARLGLPGEGTCLLVFGGSLGARTINLATLEAFGEDAPCTVLHASGRRDHLELRSRLDALGSPPHYRLLDYYQPFADLLAAADLAVSRAGGSVFELAAAGLPSILVPYPQATGDHQTHNARWMADAGAAVMVPDAELDAPRLAREVGALLSSPGRLEAMAAAARRIARPDAAERVAEATLALAED